MGLFSKRKKDIEENYDDSFFDRLKIDVENIRKEQNMKLSDFIRPDVDDSSLHFEFDGSSYSDPLLNIKQKVEKDFSKEEFVATESKKEKPEIIDSEKTATPEETVESLLDKCKAYTKDEDGNDFSKDETPIYELESVADILKSESIDALENLSKKYNIKITDETNSSKIVNSEETAYPEPETDESKDKKTEKFIEMVEQSLNQKKSDDEIFEEYIIQNNENVINADVSSEIPDISDIDNNQKMDTAEYTFTKAAPKTVTFTPIKDNEVPSGVSVSSITKTMDFGKKFDFVDKRQNNASDKDRLEQTEFDAFTVKNEIEKQEDFKGHLRKTAVKKRNAFVSSVISFISLFVVLLFFISSLNDSIITNPRTSILVCSACLTVNIISNLGIFKSLAFVFKKQLNADFACLLASVSALGLSIHQIIADNSDYAMHTYHIIVLTSVILFTRCLTNFKEISATYGNLRQISSKFQKNAVTFISDSSVTFAIAKNSIEGDVLIAAERKTDFIKDFVKYTKFNSILGGKFIVFQIIGVILAILSGVLGYIFYSDFSASLYCFSAVICIFSMPLLFFINALPLASASKKLNHHGAMISGIEGASQLETANAVVASTSEIFPEGTIVLKDMKILSTGNIDDIILRAASLTESVGSTLSPIFKQIAKSNSNYVLPDSDSVKYEERLGLSGWVDNELLFIGNRTLMESHGIEVPSIELDKKILRNGCFPIYLATVQNAIALLIVSYEPNPETAKVLRKVSSLGVTMLFTNCDPNINEEMIADYFDVYNDSIKIVSNAGTNMYKNSTSYIKSISAPAVFKHNNLSLLRIIAGASAIKKSNNLFSVFYTVFSVLLSAGFIYASFTSGSSMLSSAVLLFAELSISLISLIIYLFKKP